jgi:hypothetical protein
MNHPACQRQQDEGNEAGVAEQMGELFVDEMGIHCVGVYLSGMADCQTANHA